MERVKRNKSTIDSRLKCSKGIFIVELCESFQQINTLDFVFKKKEEIFIKWTQYIQQKIRLTTLKQNTKIVDHFE